MLDLLIAIDVLDPRIGNPGPVVEKGRQMTATDIAVLVDGRRKHGTAMLPKPHRIVGAASQERDPKGVRLMIMSWLSGEELARQTLAYCPALMMV